MCIYSYICVTIYSYNSRQCVYIQSGKMLNSVCSLNGLILFNTLS